MPTLPTTLWKPCTKTRESGTNAILAEEGNLTQALGLSLESGQWDNAQLLTQPLAQVYRMQKRYPELRRLRRQLLEVTGATAADADAKGAIELWLYLLGTEASECIETNELGRADDLNQQLLDYFTAQADANSDPRTAAVYHQTGEVALKRWQLDQAEEWYAKSLAIIEDGEDRASVADDYYGMGLVRQYQRRYTEARDWFSKSLDIHQRLEDVGGGWSRTIAPSVCARNSVSNTKKRKAGITAPAKYWKKRETRKPRC